MKKRYAVYVEAEGIFRLVGSVNSRMIADIAAANTARWYARRQIEATVSIVADGKELDVIQVTGAEAV